MNTPTEQEMAAAMEILRNTKSIFGSDLVNTVATIIHKHNEELRQEINNHKAAFDCLAKTHAVLDQDRDQLAARNAVLEDAIMRSDAIAAERFTRLQELDAQCAELEKALTSIRDDFNPDGTLVDHAHAIQDMRDCASSVLETSHSTSLKHLQELERKAKALDWLEAVRGTVTNWMLENKERNWNVKLFNGNFAEANYLLEAIESAMKKD